MKAKRLTKTVLPQKIASHSIGQLTDIPVANNKLKELDDAAKIYRNATERRNHVNEYYEIFLLFHVCISVSFVLVGAYTS